MNKEALRKELDDCWDAGYVKHKQLSEEQSTDRFLEREIEKHKQAYITTRLAALGDGDKKDGAALIAAERKRQKEVEGWTSEHDNTHFHGELAVAAACYAVYHTDSEVVQHGENAWPWEDKWWKPSDDKIKNLVRAGALIAAEIDRIQPPKPLDDGQEGKGDGEEIIYDENPEFFNWVWENYKPSTLGNYWVDKKCDYPLFNRNMLFVTFSANKPPALPIADGEGEKVGEFQQIFSYECGCGWRGEWDKLISKHGGPSCPKCGIVLSEGQPPQGKE